MSPFTSIPNQHCEEIHEEQGHWILGADGHHAAHPDHGAESGQVRQGKAAFWGGELLLRRSTGVAFRLPAEMAAGRGPFPPANHLRPLY